ncbi:MAG: short chain dehydrogenase/ reductase [Linnemannia gamsii]|nr:MAG: short chain dehydrogenase/ reductase [Linnemannia gamsii]
MSATRRVAIVTGSSRGIGRAIALRLAQDGHDVVINYQSNANKAQEAVNEVLATGNGARAIAVQGDVGILADGKRLVEETLKAFGRIDTVVFNAGWIVYQAVEDVTEESYEEAFRTNVKAPMFFTKQVIPHLAPGSKLIFLSTSLTAASTVPPNYFLYCATKGAVEQMVRTLSKDLGRKGINVNAVSPGPTDTDGFRNGKTPELIKAFSQNNPFGRLGQPEDIAGAVSFIASDSAGWVNGQILRVNGGFVV